ncbi:MAG: type II secretion system F family protein [Phycisphaerales bacterium]
MSAEVFTYRAVRSGGQKAVVRGRLEASSAAQARELLREADLLPLAVRPLSRGASSLRLPKALLQWWHAHSRSRVSTQRADLLDALSTMLLTGLPLSEALRAMETRTDNKHITDQDRILLALRSGVASGRPLSASLADHPGWFSAAEVARVNAAEQRGELAPTLAALAESSQRSVELGRKLGGALAYPLIVSAVGLAVVIFLSVKTLPELLGVLSDSGVALPGLSVAVMRFGQMLVNLAPWFPLILIAAACLPLMIAASPKAAAASGRAVTAITPRFVRRMRMAQVADELADMLDSGIQIVEGLRLIASAHSGWRTSSLRNYLSTVADRVSAGDELDLALPDQRWADSEFVRLVSAGQASGELPRVLRRIAGRYRRDATRRIDRLSALLEPVVILLLATLVGLVVMAAVLPLIRLQEVV